MRQMFRSFAIVPAAGASRRMGAAKLLLPVGGRPLIERVLGSWTASAVTRTVVVAKPDDDALVEVCRGFDVDVVVPQRAPGDMKSSVRSALGHIESNYAPAPRDAWLVAPADMPGLSTAAIDAVLAAYDAHDAAAVVPTIDGRRGHPALLPWSSAALVDTLADDEGINALVAKMLVHEVAWPDAGLVHDLDTPSDYARLP
jgi:molybdenum cofactor cytidylyltransferase